MVITFETVKEQIETKAPQTLEAVQMPVIIHPIPLIIHEELVQVTVQTVDMKSDDEANEAAANAPQTLEAVETDTSHHSSNSSCKQWRAP